MAIANIDTIKIQKNRLSTNTNKGKKALQSTLLIVINTKDTKHITSKSIQPASGSRVKINSTNKHIHDRSLSWLGTCTYKMTKRINLSGYISK